MLTLKEQTANHPNHANHQKLAKAKATTNATSQFLQALKSGDAPFADLEVQDLDASSAAAFLARESRFLSVVATRAGFANLGVMYDELHFVLLSQIKSQW